MEDTNTMYITDENGQEKAVEILFTFDAEDKHFVLFTDPSDPEEQVYAYRYDEDGNLDAVDDEKELEMCEEVLGAFQRENGEDDETDA